VQPKAQSLDYWHDVSYSNLPDPDDGETEDIMIDHCHYAMQTDINGGTAHSDIAPGLVDVPTIYGYYSFVS
jgi:hypothetical protein